MSPRKYIYTAPLDPKVLEVSNEEKLLYLQQYVSNILGVVSGMVTVAQNNVELVIKIETDVENIKFPQELFNIMKQKNLNLSLKNLRNPENQVNFKFN